MSAQAVCPPKQVWSMDFKPNLLPGNLASNPTRVYGFLASVMNCSQKMNVTIFPVQNPFRALYIDGREISWQDAKQGVELEKGEHLFVVDSTGPDYFDWFATFVFDNYEGTLTLRSPLGKGARYPFVTVGPFPADDREALDAALHSKTADELIKYPRVKPIDIDHTSTNNAAAMTSKAHPSGGEVRIDEPTAMLVASEDVTTICPATKGDTQLLMDFGVEITGFVEMELSAPEGVIIDFDGFENMEPDRIQWPQGVDCVYRYTTHRGIADLALGGSQGLSLQCPDGAIPQGGDGAGQDQDDPVLFEHISVYRARTFQVQ